MDDRFLPVVGTNNSKLPLKTSHNVNSIAVQEEAVNKWKHFG